MATMSCVSLLLAASTLAGPGLLVRNAERYYKPPVLRVLHGPARLPTSPPPEMAAAFQEADLFALREAGYLDGYPGPDWDREGPCTRYQAAFLLGGFLEELSRDYGEVVHVYKFGPRRRLLPREAWGKDRVALALSVKLLRPRGLPWWHEAPSRFQVAGWLEDLLHLLEPKLVVLTDPRPYRRAAEGGDLPAYGHPLRRVARRALEAGLMVAPEGRFRGREPLGAREWVRIVNRLRFLADGYRASNLGETRVDAAP